MFDLGVCTVLYENCVKAGEAVVKNVSTKPKTKYRPFPLNTVKLQQLATGKLRISSDAAMEAAESLYTKGFISYPRTETDAFAEGTPFQQLIEDQVSHPEWGEYAAQLSRGGKFREPKRGKSNDQAHTAIYPTKRAENLHGVEKSIYELVTRHFLACCSDDAKGSETVVNLELGGEAFTLTGLVILERNYLEVYYKYDKWTDKDIPNFVAGERVRPKSIALDSGVTTAPSLLTEKDLITLMDKHGIGTDATIAQHIKTVQDRNYCVKQNDVFSPTNLGVTLVNGFDRMGFDFSQPHLRAETERDMQRISSGELRAEDAKARNITVYKTLYQKQMQQVHVLDEEFQKHFQPAAVGFSRKTPNVARCGQCKGMMSVAQEGRVQYVVCEPCNQSYVVDSRETSVVSGTGKECPICSFEVVSVDTGSFSFNVCPKCKSNPPIEYFSPDGRTDCRGCRHPSCSLAQGRSSLPVRMCPGCGKEMMTIKTSAKNNSMFFSCSAYPGCKTTLALPNCVSAHASDSQCQQCSGTHGKPVHKVDFTFTRAQAPRDSPELTGAFCVAGCNSEINRLLTEANPNAKLFYQAGRQAPNQNQQRGFGGGGAGAGAGGSSDFLQNSFQRLASGVGANVRMMNGSDSAPNCNCGAPARELIVKKDGQNKGRAFYGCANRDNQCKFFVWKDEHVAKSSGAAAGPPSSNGPARGVSSGGGSSGSGGDAICFCGKPAVRKVAQDGREYFGCGNTGPVKCNMFDFANGDSIQTGGNSYANFGGGGGSNMNNGYNNNYGGGVAGGGGNNGRANNNGCFKCGQVGHFSADCPNANGGRTASAPAATGRGRGRGAGRAKSTTGAAKKKGVGRGGGRKKRKADDEE